jgi:hypothetical protein
MYRPLLAIVRRPSQHYKELLYVCCLHIGCHSLLLNWLHLTDFHYVGGVTIQDAPYEDNSVIEVFL